MRTIIPNEACTIETFPPLPPSAPPRKIVLDGPVLKSVRHSIGEAIVSTAKEEVRRLLDELPDDASFEDIQYHIYVREKIDLGRKGVREGRVVSQEEAERRMAEWIEE